MSNTTPSRADPVVVFPLSRRCPPQETSQPHPPHLASPGHQLPWYWLYRINRSLYSKRSDFIVERAGLILGLRPANERRRYFVTTSLIGWVQEGTRHQAITWTYGNSSPPSAAHICWWNGSALVQIMAYHLDGAQPLSEPMLTYCQLEPKEDISMKFYLKLKYFLSRKCIWACCLRNGSHFVQGEMS